MKCEKCGLHEVAHKHGRADGKGWHNLCCVCHVEGGSPPADWHPLCMKTYAERRADSTTGDT